jgi:secondary thiamine-phosphate synthase enzyme
MRSKLLTLEMADRRIADITETVADFVRGEADGIVNVFAPHATAGLALMETGSGSESDLEQVLNELLPRDDRWSHSHGSKGHGADHVLPAFVTPTLVIPVMGGEMQLGTWQSVVFVDLNRDNPQRNVRISFIPA